MKLPLSELRSVISEQTDLAKYRWGGWVLETLDAVREEFEEELTYAGFTKEYIKQEGLYWEDISKCTCIGRLRGLLSTLGLDRTSASDIVSDFVEVLLTNLDPLALDRTVKNSSRYAMRDFWLVVPDDEVNREDGGDEWADGTDGTTYVAVLVKVGSLDGHILHTAEDRPGGIWSYDPETLETIEVPTIYELMKQSPSKPRLAHPYARLRDIESGKL